MDLYLFCRCLLFFIVGKMRGQDRGGMVLEAYICGTVQDT